MIIIHTCTSEKTCTNTCTAAKIIVVRMAGVSWPSSASLKSNPQPLALGNNYIKKLIVVIFINLHYETPCVPCASERFVVLHAGVQVQVCVLVLINAHRVCWSWRVTLPLCWSIWSSGMPWQRPCWMCHVPMWRRCWRR